MRSQYENLKEKPSISFVPIGLSVNWERHGIGRGCFFMDEIWKSISGYETRYEISNLGRVKSLVGKPKILVPGIDGRTRYAKIWLSDNGKITMKYIHRLVAEAFVPNPDKKPHVNHKDFNRVNNIESNLEWVTPVENTNHSFVAGRFHHLKYLCGTGWKTYHTRKQKKVV